jgi:2-polyprenyl-3-methyl-5-hydroxy-6-metoxy-1,4-benzoquinol methylase
VLEAAVGDDEAIEVTLTEQTEAERLDKLADQSRYEFGPMALVDEYLVSALQPWWKGTRCLELGPAEGLITSHLVDHFPEITVVEGAASLCARLTADYPTIRVIHSLFEDFRPDGQYDTVILGHVLEHVTDPGALLSRIASWLADGGVVCASVPNALSFHRQLGVELKMLNDVHDLNASDIAVGHRRVYDPDTLRNEFERAGLSVQKLSGYFLKLNSAAQITDHPSLFSEEFLRASLALGELHPRFAAEIYVVATAHAR